MSRTRVTCRASAPSASTERMGTKLGRADALWLRYSAAPQCLCCDAEGVPACPFTCRNGILRACACMRWLLTAREACSLSQTSMRVCHYRAGHKVKRLCVRGPMSTPASFAAATLSAVWRSAACKDPLGRGQGDQECHGSQCSSCFIRSCCRYP